MAPKGLKVGDTFVEEGFTFKVLKVVGDNYESQMIKAAEGFVGLVEVKEEAREEVKEDYLSMQYAQLKKLCAERGLDAKGSKNDLIARLEG